MTQFEPLEALNALTGIMLEALKEIGHRGVTAEELGVGPSALTGLVRRGLLSADYVGGPALYFITPAGQAVIAAMSAPVAFVEHEGGIQRIQRTVAAHFNIPAREMVSSRRQRHIARPRQVAMYLARELTPKSLPDIGRRFGNRDHTTVLHALKQVERLTAEDAAFRDEVSALKTLICAPTGDKSHNSAFLLASQVA